MDNYAELGSFVRAMAKWAMPSAEKTFSCRRTPYVAMTFSFRRQGDVTVTRSKP